MKIFEFFICVITGRMIEKSRPNFVVLVTDAFDGRIVKNRSYKNIVEVINLISISYKNTSIQLENIEKLQEAGKTYENTYCDSPLCVPSRAALLSGRQNHVIEAWNNFKGVDPTKFRNWTEELQENF